MSPLPPIDVQPEVFDAASKVMGQNVADQIGNAQTTLQDALATTGAMAGTDPGGSRWAASYDPAVTDTIAAVTDLGNACYQLAAMLEQTGFNHGMAESASDPTRSVPSPADTTRYTVQPNLSCDAPPPSAAGGSGSAPSGWGLIEHLVGYVWPSGHQDKLRAAAKAWSTAASSLDWASYAIDEAGQAISSQKSPEVEDATTVVRGMKQHIEDVAAACRTLSTGCSAFAGHLDDAHHDVKHELVSLLEWTAGIEAAGGLFSVVTFGLSEAGAQAAEATRIAATASRVAAIIVRLIDLAGTVAETVATVVTKIGEVAQRLKLILGARLSEATATLVARIPGLGKDAEALATRELAAAADASGTAPSGIIAGYDQYAGMSESEFLARYYDSDTGFWRYPENNGAVAGTEKDVSLPAGTQIDRFGDPSGGYLSPKGTPYAERSLPPSNLDDGYHAYSVTGEPLPDGFRVEQADVAPGFGQSGGGLQYRIVGPNGRTASVSTLIKEGYLRVSR